MDARDRRRGELHRLRESDPSQLISMYRKLATLDGDSSLPVGTTFVSMVEAILDNEISTAAISSDESH